MESDVMELRRGESGKRRGGKGWRGAEVKGKG